MKFLHPEFETEPASSLATATPQVEITKTKYKKPKGITEKTPETAIPQQLVGYKEFSAKIKAKYPYYKDIDDLKLAQRVVEKYPVYAPKVTFDGAPKPIKIDVPTLAKAGVKGAMETYRTLGAATQKPLEVVEGLYESVTGKKHPAKAFRKQVLQTAEEFWQPTEQEVQAMDDAGFMGKVIPGVIQAIGNMPIYIAAGGIGGGIGKAMFGKLAARVGSPAAQRAIALMEHWLGIGTGFAGSAVARGIGEEKPVGEILYDAAMSYGTAPAYVLGSSFGGSIGRAITKSVSPKFGQLAGQMVGGAASIGGSTALAGGSTEEVAESATIGAVLPLFISNPYFKNTKKAVKTENVTHIKKTFSKEINAYKGTKVGEILQEIPEMYRGRLLNALLTDQMTGVKNRKAMTTLATMPETKSVGMIDIDGMKGINTKHTHVGGDIAKKAVAKIGDAIAKKHGRHFGIVGGEEFILTNPTKAIMEEIRVAVGNTKLTYQGKPIKLTVSGGIAEVGKGHDLFAGASKAMLKAKEAGRNRIMGDIPVFQEAQVVAKEFNFFKVANQLKVPFEQQQSIMESLRYNTPKQAVAVLKKQGINISEATLKSLEPLAKGHPGVDREYQNSITKAFEAECGNMDAMIQDIAKIEGKQIATLKKNISKKFQQWRVSNAREAQSELKAILDQFGIKDMPKYIKGIKPEGKGAESFIMTHKETAELLKKADFKSINKTFGKDGYTVLIAGQKKYADAVTYADAFRKISAKYFMEKNPVMKAKYAEANTKLGNMMMSAYTEYRLLQADAGRFIEYAKVGKKGEGYKILNNLDNFMKSGKGFEGLTETNIERAMDRATKAPTSEPGAVAKSMAPGLMDYVNEWQKAVKLTAPSTHIVNLSSNTFNYVVNAGIEKSLATMWDMIGASVGKPRTTYMGEMKYGAKGARIGFTKGISDAFQALLYDKPKLKGIGRAYETARYGQVIPGKVGYAVRTPFRFLEAGDMFGKSVNYYTSLGHELYAKYKKAGWKGKQLDAKINEGFKKPPEKLSKIAEAKAEEWLYREKLDPVNKQVQSTLQKAPILQLVVPFFRTPVNVTKWAYRRLPVAGLPGKNLADIKLGGRPAREALARQTFGTIIVGAVIAAHKAGMVTGSAPRDPDERARFYAAGKMPYALRVGDKYYGLARVEPFTTLFKMTEGVLQAVDKYGEAKKEDKEEMGTLFMDGVTNVSNALLDQTYVIGLNDMFNAMSDPGRYGMKFIKNIGLGSTIPAGAGYVARAIDPTLREGKSMIDVAKTRIPGMSQELEPRLSPLGEEQMRPELAGRLQSMIQPGPELGEVSMTNKEIERLDVALPYPIASRKVTDKESGKKIDIPIKDYNELVKYTGGVMKYELDRLVATPEYQQANDETQKAMLENTIKAVNKVLKRYVDNFKTKILQQEVKK